MAENHKRVLLELMSKEGNNVCADCGADLNKDADKWAAYNLGIFICTKCAGVHRSLGAHISKVKSVTLDKWDDDQVKMMESVGNTRAKVKYESLVPVCYKRPNASSVQVVREQWIRAKYDRCEFMDPNKQSYLTGEKEGNLWKKGKDDNKFQSRRFVLSMKENKLEYFVKNANQPKAVIRLDEINATFVPDKIGNINGLQLTYPTDKEIRHLYLFAEDGKDIVDWYNAIRNAKLYRLRIGLPTSSDEELAQRLTRDYVMEGWLSKKGPKPNDRYLKRWCSLDGRLFMYQSDTLSAMPAGEFGIGTEETGFSMSSNGIVNEGYGFTISTPNRDYQFVAETEQERNEWLIALKKIMDQELTPHDVKLLAKYSGK